MAVLPNAERVGASYQFGKEMSALAEPCAGEKSDLRVLINAIDDWIELNVASLNLAIPLPQRTLFTARQKMRALWMVVEARRRV